MGMRCSLGVRNRLECFILTSFVLDISRVKVKSQSSCGDAGYVQICQNYQLRVKIPMQDYKNEKNRIMNDQPT